MKIALAHGASGDAASMKPYLDALRLRGLDGVAVQLPVKRAETAIDAYRQQLELHGLDLPTSVIGGQSYGGRVASLLALDDRPAGLVLMCYPLHPPGKRDWEGRVEHWPRIGCPVLLLSGEADPLAKIDLLGAAVELLPKAELVTYPGVGHGLKPVLEDAMERVARFAAGIAGNAA
jgi:uncharacterized protein